MTNKTIDDLKQERDLLAEAIIQLIDSFRKANPSVAITISVEPKIERFADGKEFLVNHTINVKTGIV